MTRRRGRFGRRRPDAESASGFVDAALDKLGVDPGWRAVAAWSDVCGPTIAKKTCAIELRNAVLHVRVPSASWAHEMSFVKTELCERLRAKTRLRIDDLRFSVGPLPPAPPAEPERPQAKERPVTAELTERVDAATAAVGDPELREALRALGLRVLA